MSAGDFNGTRMLDSDGRDDPLDRVLGAYFEAIEAGRRPDRGALLREHPGLAVELAEFFALDDMYCGATAPSPPPPGETELIDRPEPSSMLEGVGPTTDYALLGVIKAGGM